MQVTSHIPSITNAILAQGYNVAWSEADVAWLVNPFERFFKSHELVGVYESEGMPETGGISRPGALRRPHGAQRLTNIDSCWLPWRDDALTCISAGAEV